MARMVPSTVADFPGAGCGQTGVPAGPLPRIGAEERGDSAVDRWLPEMDVRLQHGAALDVSVGELVNDLGSVDVPALRAVTMRRSEPIHPAATKATKRTLSVLHHSPRSHCSRVSDTCSSRDRLSNAPSSERPLSASAATVARARTPCPDCLRPASEAPMRRIQLALAALMPALFVAAWRCG